MADKDERTVLVCVPTYEPAATPSRIFNCEVCGQEVWVSPASLIAVGANPRIICTACITNVLASDPDVQIMPTTEAQKRELENR
jgi:hypothetical protein